METTIKKIAETPLVVVYELQHNDRTFLLNSAGGILEITDWSMPLPSPMVTYNTELLEDVRNPGVIRELTHDKD